MEKKKKLSAVIITLAVVIVIALVCVFVLYFNGFTDLRTQTQYKENQTKIACVGDSVTYGYSISNRSKYNYPKVLGNMLSDEYCVYNFGVSGCTVQDTSDQPYRETKYYEQSKNCDADIVIFMLGSNDSKDKNWKDAETWKKAYISLIDEYINAENKPTVYLCTLAQVYYAKETQTEGDMKYGIKKENIDTMNNIIREVAEQKNLTLIDVNSATSDNRELFWLDGLHPNKNGAKLIAKTVYDSLSL